MFKNKFFKGGLALLLLIIAGYFIAENVITSTETVSDNMNPEIYYHNIEDERTAKDEEFRTSDNSPIENKEAFQGLSYFEPDLQYRVMATLVPYKGDDKRLVINYTDGTETVYEKFAYATFNLHQKSHKVLLLLHDDMVSLLFKDDTNGKTTYGGGRYLDFKINEASGRTMVIDFNKSYNPYCAYVPDYACPLPPAENKLSISIPAGEKYEIEK
jgi:uncharacterized protein (DUF1684 family)